MSFPCTEPVRRGNESKSITGLYSLEAFEICNVDVRFWLSPLEEIALLLTSRGGNLLTCSLWQGKGSKEVFFLFSVELQYWIYQHMFLQVKKKKYAQINQLKKRERKNKRKEEGKNNQRNNSCIFSHVGWWPNPIARWRWRWAASIQLGAAV